MPTSSQKIHLGIFIVISSIALIILIFIVGSRQFFQDQEIYYISYSDVSVSGLEIGSPVKNLGVRIGSIQSIDFDPNDINNVILTIAVKPGVSIRKDSQANIESIGITGLKMIEIRGGSNAAPVLDPGGTILAGSSITEDITGKAEIIANKVEKVINNLLDFSQPEKLNKIIMLAESSTEAMENINKMVAENRRNLRDGLASGSTVMARLDTITRVLKLSAMAIQKITASDTLEQIVANVHEVSAKLNKANLVILVDRLGEVVEKTNRILITVDKDIERGSKDFLASLQTLKSTLDYLNEVARIINEDPSILVKGGEVKDIPDDDLD